jgi:hypothetical protein
MGPKDSWLFIKAPHMTLLWARLNNEFTPSYPTSFKIQFNIISPPIYAQVLQVVSFFCFPTKNPVCISPLSCMWHMPNSPNISCFIHSNNTVFGEEYKSLSSLLGIFLPFPANSYLSAQNIFLSTLFSNTLSLCSSLNVSNPADLTLKGVQFVLRDSTEGREQCALHVRNLFAMNTCSMNVSQTYF